jgi:hypothetical protein
MKIIEPLKLLIIIIIIQLAIDFKYKKEKEKFFNIKFIYFSIPFN